MKSDSTRSLMKATKELPRRKRQNRGRGGQNSSSLLRFEGLEERTMLSAMSVVNTADSGAGSLRQAILDANAQEGADFIQFAESVQGTISLTSGQLAITDELTIDGPGADVLTVSGSGMSRVFHVAGATATIDDVTIADGLATDFVPESPDLASFASGGGLLNLSGNVTLNRVLVTGNSTQNAVGTGAGVANAFGANMVVNDSTFSDNQAFGLLIGAGGAISGVGQSSITVNDSLFSGNIAVAASGLNPDVTYSGLAAGGAIAVGDASLSITNSQFENNNAKAGDGIAGSGQDAGFAIGGAVAFGNVSLTGVGPSSIDVTGSTFTGNQSIGGKGADGPDGVRGGHGGPAWGGAIHLHSGVQANVASSNFSGNQAIMGDGGQGGMGADGGDSGFYGGLTTSKDAAGEGGALSLDGGTLTLLDSSFTNNTVRGGTGGRSGTGGNGGDSLTVAGGAIKVTPYTSGFELPASAEITNVTLTNNKVIAGYGGDGDASDGKDGPALGGAFYTLSDNGKSGLAETTITDTTVSGNVVQGNSSAKTDGPGILADIGATLKLTNVAISDNKAVIDGEETVVDGYTCEGIPTADGCVAAQQGDADRDGQFDRQDIEQVLQAGKYGTGEDAVWREGDWNNDGRFDQADIIAALQAGNYLA